MDMKTEILRLLKAADGYISGQELCERFSVSRTAVWKVINQLKSEGYDIRAVRNKGYFLSEVPDSLSQAELESGRTSRWAGGSLVFYPVTDSTNIRARKLAEADAPHGALVVADMQETGKGRRGRGWACSGGSSIFMSLLLRPALPPSHASMLTLVAALAVAEGIRRTTGDLCRIKWPNDLVINGKKVCGILTEMQAEMEEIHSVVVGIGINVNTESFPEEIAATATSLFLESGRKTNRGRLIWAVMEAFEDCYGKFMETQDLSGLKDSYEAILANLGKKVRVLAPSGDYEGLCRGIDRDGQLLVEMEDGTLRRVASGEVSVRGIYGYADD